MLTTNFNIIPVISDDQSWVWLFLENALQAKNLHYVKLSSAESMRLTWERVKNAQRIVIHWEGKHRSGGAIIEEILEINPHYDIGKNVIVITTNPVRDDVVYLSELGVKRLMRLRHKDSEMKKFAEDLFNHISLEFTTDKIDLAWQKLQRMLDAVNENTPPERLDKLQNQMARLHEAQGAKPSARLLDGYAIIANACKDYLLAEKFWHDAINLNPNFFRAYNGLSEFYQERGNFNKALEILHRVHNLNRQRISRLVEFGNVHLQIGDFQKAEHYFQRAVKADKYCGGALNGLAEIRFHEGHLDEARSLLEKTTLAYRFAVRLNNMGIQLVKQARYEDALDHYTRAQYVLPQREKGARLFYNIALCYYKWHRPDLAVRFAQLALIKEPNYKKAMDLLERSLKAGNHKVA